VKSADNTMAKSLKVYIERYKPQYAIKLSARKFGFEDGKKTVPLYAAFCIIDYLTLIMKNAELSQNSSAF